MQLLFISPHFAEDKSAFDTAQSTALDKLPPQRLKVHIKTKQGTEKKAVFCRPPPPLLPPPLPANAPPTLGGFPGHTL